MDVVMVRVPVDLIKKLRKRFPELDDEGNAYLVRTALRKFLQKPK